MNTPERAASDWERVLDDAAARRAARRAGVEPAPLFVVASPDGAHPPVASATSATEPGGVASSARVTGPGANAAVVTESGVSPTVVPTTAPTTAPSARASVASKPAQVDRPAVVDATDGTDATDDEDDEVDRDTEPLYPRLLRLRNVHPNAWQRATFVEGMVFVGLLGALADKASWWAPLAMPVAAAVVVKFHDVLTGVLRPPASGDETAVEPTELGDAWSADNDIAPPDGVMTRGRKERALSR